MVPTHLPNKIPDRISKGEPNPRSTTQITENTENRIRLILNFFQLFPLNLFGISCNKKNH